MSQAGKILTSYSGRLSYSGQLFTTTGFHPFCLQCPIYLNLRPEFYRGWLRRCITVLPLFRASCFIQWERMTDNIYIDNSYLNNLPSCLSPDGTRYPLNPAPVHRSPLIVAAYLFLIAACTDVALFAFIFSIKDSSPSLFSQRV